MGGLELYEVYMNNSKNNFDRVSANSKEEAERIIQDHYPDERVTGSILL